MQYSLFNPGSIIVELESTEKEEAIREIIRKSPIFCHGIDRDCLEEAVIARERIQSTGVGHGVAFAHGKLAEIGNITIALGISRQGLVFGSHDGKPVHLLFVVATNHGQHIDYLKCLAGLASLLRREQFRSELLACARAEEAAGKLHQAWAQVHGLAAAS
jgi:nitrogen PTS system EIIA component